MIFTLSLAQGCRSATPSDDRPHYSNYSLQDLLANHCLLEPLLFDQIWSIYSLEYISQTFL